MDRIFLEFSFIFIKKNGFASQKKQRLDVTEQELLPPRGGGGRAASAAFQEISPCALAQKCALGLGASGLQLAWGKSPTKLSSGAPACSRSQSEGMAAFQRPFRQPLCRYRHCYDCFQGGAPSHPYIPKKCHISPRSNSCPCSFRNPRWCCWPFGRNPGLPQASQSYMCVCVPKTGRKCEL